MPPKDFRPLSGVPSLEGVLQHIDHMMRSVLTSWMGVARSSTEDASLQATMAVTAFKVARCNCEEKCNLFREALDSNTLSGVSLGTDVVAAAKRAALCANHARDLVAIAAADVASSHVATQLERFVLSVASESSCGADKAAKYLANAAKLRDVAVGRLSAILPALDVNLVTREASDAVTLALCVDGGDRVELPPQGALNL